MCQRIAGTFLQTIFTESFIKQGTTHRLPREFSAIIATLSIINIHFVYDIAADANRVCGLIGLPSGSSESGLNIPALIPHPSAMMENPPHFPMFKDGWTLLKRITSLLFKSTQGRRVIHIWVWCSVKGLLQLKQPCPWNLWAFSPARSNTRAVPKRSQWHFWLNFHQVALTIVKELHHQVLSLNC